MYKAVYLLPLLLFFISCKKTTNTTSEIILNSKDTISKVKFIDKENDNIVSYEYKVLLSDSLDYSIDYTILQEFSNKLVETKHKASIGNKLVLDTYPTMIEFENDLDSIQHEKLRKLNFDLPNEIYLKKGDSFKISTPEIYELFKKANEINFYKIKEDSLNIYHSVLKKSKEFTLYTFMFNTTVDCYSCEYGYKYAAKYLVSIKNSNNEILDVIKVSSIAGNDIGRDYKFYYYNNNKIHSIYFKGDEEEYMLLDRENYIIDDFGRIVNYYEKDGDFISDNEKGLVKNNRRFNNWIIKKDIGLFNSLNIYIEGNYINGVRQGEFSSYMLNVNEDKKGKLIYKATYENGKMIFLNK